MAFLPGESQGRGAWWAALYGVAKSHTRLKLLSSSSSFIASVTIYSDFGAPKYNVTVSTVSQSICHEMMGPDVMILVS